MEALDQKENFIDYISHRPGVQKDGEHGLWDANGKVQNLARAVREVAEHTGNVWTPVIALRREDAERLGYDSAESWRALVNAPSVTSPRHIRSSRTTCAGMPPSTKSRIRCIST